MAENDSTNPATPEAADMPTPPAAPEAAAASPADDPVAAKLREFGADDTVVSKVKDDLGVESVEDLSMLKEQDLLAAGMKTVQVRKLLAGLAPAAAAPTETAALSAVNFDGVLPGVPDDSSWLSALRTGGVLKVDQSSVIAAIRAALANTVGLYQIPDKLVSLMEQFAETNDEQVPSEFFKLRKQLTQRRYADLFEAIDGLDGNFVNDARRKDLFRKVEGDLWPALLTFNDQLQNWLETWQKQGFNPMMLMGVFSSMSGGGAVLPPGMMAPPDTAALRDYADTVKDRVNRVFAGFGVQIAAALAYDATRIRQTLEDPRLPSLIGVANREQMLKQLGVAVSSAYPRLETNLTRYVLGIMNVENVAAGNEELSYLSALAMLGAQIPWGEIGGRNPAAAAKFRMTRVGDQSGNRL